MAARCGPVSKSAVWAGLGGVVSNLVVQDATIQVNARCVFPQRHDEHAVPTTVDTGFCHDVRILSRCEHCEQRH